jgi:dienelactone hydrolase
MFHPYRYLSLKRSTRPPQLPLDVVGPFLGGYRLQFRRRLFAGLGAFQHRSECKPSRIAAVGYWIGGCGVLELARAGVAAARGGVNARNPECADSGSAKGCRGQGPRTHGDADPVAPFEQLAAFRDEIRSAGANWEIDIYGEARHTFTGEGIFHRRGPEAALHPQSETRSWRTMIGFLAEVLK